MSIVTVVSTKHSPGATTLAMLLANVADPFTLPLVLEADPAGGDLAARTGSLFDPGMASAVEAALLEPAPRLLDEHCRPLPSGVGVVIGSLTPARLSSYVVASAEILAPLARCRAGATLVDAGRWSTPAAAAWAAASDATLVVMRAEVDSAEHVAVRLPEIEAVCPLVRAVVMGSGSLSVRDVTEIIERPVWSIPHDALSAKAVCAGDADVDELRTKAIWKAAELILDELTNLISFGQRSPAARRNGHQLRG
ncbi:MAG: hypothetical protein ACKV2O_20150 [Acidimicrobiales bacterium]